MTDVEVGILQMGIAAEVGKLVAVANERIDAKNTEITSLRAELSRAIADLEKTEALLHKANEMTKTARTELSTLKHAIVTTIGGVDYEGFPTSEINYLQRLRILVEKETRLKEAERVIDASNNIGTFADVALLDDMAAAYLAKYPKETAQ